MKKWIFILLLIIIVLISYVNIKEPDIKEKADYIKKEDKKTEPVKKETAEIDEAEQALFPEVYDIGALNVDYSLPILKFKNAADTMVVDSSAISITVEIPQSVSRTDLYLFVEKVKKDMYYQVEPGVYSFNDIKIKPGENLIELFYRKGSRRSQSISSVIIKKY